MKKTTRFHRGDSPFKMASPLKNSGDNNSEGTSSSTEKIARSGDTKVVYRKKVSNKQATANVEVNQPKKYVRQKPKHTKEGDAFYARQSKAKQKELDAKWNREHPPIEVKSGTPGKTESKKNETNIEEEAVPVKTEKVEGTTSDTFTAEERRIQNRGEKINMRQERQLGRQGLRRDKRFMKQSADWQSMTREEKKAAMNELKHGKASTDKTPSSLEARFGKEFKDRVNKEREMKHGQGEMNKALIDQEVKNPGDARATRMEQYTQGKGWVNSTETENKADIEKKQAGGKDVKVTEQEKKELENVPMGKRSYTANSDSSQTNTEKSGEKAKNYFQEALKKFDSNKTITSKPLDNKEQSDPTSRANAVKATTPEKDASSQARSISRENSKWGKEEDSPLNMTKKASGFSMKGFGSKSGFKFNIKK